MKKRLLNSLLLSILMVVGVTTVWAVAKAKYTPTLTEEYAVEGYNVKAYYDLSLVDANGICPTDTTLDVRYREGWGLYNYGPGLNASADVAVSVSEGDLVLVEFIDTQKRDITINEISNCTKNEDLSSGAILAYEVNADATSLNIDMGRRGCVVAILVLEKDNSKVATYAVQVGETHTAGETVEVKADDKVVATLTFGFEGGAEFKAAKADSHISGFVATTEGNGENGKADSGTTYIINPKYDGKIEVGVVLNADKGFYILENGTALADYDGIKVAEKYYGTFAFDVKGGKEYKVYGSGTKLGFYGIKYTILPSYTVNEVANGTVVRTTVGSAEVGASVAVPYRKYNVLDGKLYKKEKGLTNKNEFNYTFTFTEDGQEENIEYDATDVENVIFLAEGEDIEGLEPITVANANIRSSNSAAGRAEEDTEIVELEAGIYTVHVAMYDKTKGGGTTFTFKAGEETYELTAGENFSEGEFEMTLNAATSLILGAKVHNNMGLDAIYVVKTGDVSVDEPLYETVDLTEDMFYEWDGFGADANALSKAYGEFNIGNEANPGATIYGHGSVIGAMYADLTGATKLLFEGTTGVVVRALFNRQSMDGNGPEFVEKKETIGENGKAEIDLTDLPYAHLNVIKLDWGSAAGTVTSIKIVKPAEAGLTLPITEDFEGETSIFEGGELFDAADLGHVLLVKNTTATANLAGYTPAEDEKVTVKFTAYQGWESGDKIATVSVKNSEGKDLVSYTYGITACNVTDVAIGGETATDFEAFFGQSNTNGTKSANTFGHGSQPFLADESANPVVTMSITGAGFVEFNLEYTSNSGEIQESFSGALPEGTKIDLGSLVVTSTGTANTFGIDNLSITSAEAGEQPGDENVRRWDFTNWSEKTVANLKADAALGTDEGWSDDEKNDGSNMDATAGNCFWAITTPNENGELLANGEVIEELKGLVFGTNVNNRGLAIAVNYPKALSDYHGPAYLWLGGANKQFFTIPAVAGGSYITMGIESHKASDARGIQLLVGGEKLGDAFTPTVYAENTWTVPAGEAVDIVVDNTNGCHIYFIEVSDKAPETTGITETVKTQPQFEDGAIYNLQGQKVQKAQKGLYIINGKKVLVK